MLSGLPFLFVIFFSTTYSPGAGVAGLKALRYLFSRYYFFCMVPQIPLEGCPDSDLLSTILLVLTSLISLFLFLAVRAVQIVCKCMQEKGELRNPKHKELCEIERLQHELYGSDESVLSLCAPGAPPGGSFIADALSSRRRSTTRRSSYRFLSLDKVVVRLPREVDEDEETGESSEVDYPSLIVLPPDSPAHKASHQSFRYGRWA